MTYIFSQIVFLKYILKSWNSNAIYLKINVFLQTQSVEFCPKFLHYVSISHTFARVLWTVQRLWGMSGRAARASLAQTSGTENFLRDLLHPPSAT